MTRMRLKSISWTLLLLAPVASVFCARAGDVWEIRPCDESGRSIAPVATYDAPLGSGTNLYFNIRLITRDDNTGKTGANRGSFELVRNGNSCMSDAVSREATPLKVGIVVSPFKRMNVKVKWAHLVKLQRTPSGASFAENLYDAIFTYRVEPGDFALPIRLANDKNSTLIQDETRNPVFANDGEWQIKYFKDGVALGDAEFAFKGEGERASAPSVADSPDSDVWSTNYDLSKCGFYVQTVKATEESVEIEKGETKTVELTVDGMVTNAAVLYAWCMDETVAIPTGKNVNESSIDIYKDGKKITVTFDIGSIYILGGQTKVRLELRGVSQGATTVCLSNARDPHYTKDFDRLIDYKTIPVTCVEPNDGGEVTP